MDPNKGEKDLRKKVEKREDKYAESLIKAACMEGAQECKPAPFKNKASRGVCAPKKRTRSKNRFFAKLIRERGHDVAKLFSVGSKFYLNGIKFEIVGVGSNTLTIAPIREEEQC